MLDMLESYDMPACSEIVLVCVCVCVCVCEVSSVVVQSCPVSEQFILLFVMDNSFIFNKTTTTFTYIWLL